MPLPPAMSPRDRCRRHGLAWWCKLVLSEQGICARLPFMLTYMCCYVYVSNTCRVREQVQ